MKIGKLLIPALVLPGTACSPSRLLDAWQENKQRKATIAGQEQHWKELALKNDQARVGHASIRKNHPVA